MFDINLVPEVQKQKQAQAQRNTFATIGSIAVVGIMLAVLVILGSLKVAASLSLKNTQKNIDEVRAESEQYKELEETVLSLESGLAGIRSTLDGQNSWTLLLPHLEAATPNDVRYNSLGIQNGIVTAQLTGKTVESLARFIQSYENYKVVVLSGTGPSQEQIKFSLDGNSIGATKVKSNGSWVYALKVSTDQDFVIESSGAVADKVIYTASTKELRSESGRITTGTANLFKDISTKQYAKDGNGVTFDCTYTIATEVLW